MVELIQLNGSCEERARTRSGCATLWPFFRSHHKLSSFTRTGPMSPQPTDRITRLLQAWHDGDTAAASELMPLVYGELHRLASGYMRRERRGHTLQATALLNEAYSALWAKTALTGARGRSSSVWPPSSCGASSLTTRVRA